MVQEKYVITKKVAKQGNKSVILIPKMLQDRIKPDMLVQIEIQILGESQ